MFQKGHTPYNAINLIYFQTKTFSNYYSPKIRHYQHTSISSIPLKMIVIIIICFNIGTWMDRAATGQVNVTYSFDRQIPKNLQIRLCHCLQLSSHSNNIAMIDNSTLYYYFTRDPFFLSFSMTCATITTTSTWPSSV